MTIGPGPVTPMVKKLLIANGVVFLLQFMIGPLVGVSTREGFSYMVKYLGLVPKLAVDSGYLWQLVTYQFLHGGFFHILLNMFILWMFGVELERLWKQEGFLKFYLICGIAAGLSMILVNYGRVPETTKPTIGASGAIYGLLGAYAYFWPNREVYVWFIFPVKIKYFVLFIGGIEFFVSVTQTSTGTIANTAHVGGLVMGLVYVHFSDPRGSLLQPVKDWFKRKKVERKRREWKKQEQKRSKMVKDADEILDKLRELSWEELSDYEKNRIQEISDELDEME